MTTDRRIPSELSFRAGTSRRTPATEASPELAAYGCCAQANGDAACSAELSAVIDCARTSGKAAFTTCLTALVPQCFP